MMMIMLGERNMSGSNSFKTTMAGDCSVEDEVLLLAVRYNSGNSNKVLVLNSQREDVHRGGPTVAGRMHKRN